MDAGEPRPRRRGMFFQGDTEIDQVETDAAEGIPVRSTRKVAANVQRKLRPATTKNPAGDERETTEDPFGAQQQLRAARSEQI